MVQIGQAQIQHEVEGKSKITAVDKILEIKSTNANAWIDISNTIGITPVSKGYIGIYNGDNDVDFGTNNSSGKTHLVTQTIPRLTVASDGKVGIGVTDPDAKLEVDGQIKITGGSPGVNKVLVSDADGLASWAALPSSPPMTYAVGDFAQGGIVFWVDETGQHGLVCAKTDQSTSMRWYAGTYGNTQAKGDGPYSGEANTAIIISSQVAIGDDGNTYAARLCNELQITEVGGPTYGDWYLPSKEELNLIYQNKGTIDAVATANGGSVFADSFYWSSSELDAGDVWRQSFLSGNQDDVIKFSVNHVRAIRAF